MPKPLARALLLLGPFILVAVLVAILELVLVALDLPSAEEGPVAFDGLQDQSRVIRPDPDLLFRFAPETDFLGYYRTNALGYRGAGRPAPRREVLLRVVTIGDSCTFGLGVAESATFSARLGDMLRGALEGVGDADVVSLGIPGYSSWQNRRQLEIGLEGLEPDVVVWMPTGYNDAVASGGRSDAERGAAERSWRGWLARRRVVRLVTGPPTVDLEREQAGLAVLHDGAAPRVPVESFARQLEAGGAAASSHGAALVLVRPALGDALLRLDPELATREAEVAATAARLSRPMVDARRTFAKFDGIPLTSDGLHPNVDGHALLAADLFKMIVRTDGLFPDGPRRRFLVAYLDAYERGIGDRSALLGDEAGWPPAMSEATGEGESFLHAEAWLDALEAERSDDPSAPALRRRAALRDQRVAPPDLLRSLLWGAGSPTLPDAATLALARRLASFGSRFGLRPMQVDRAYVAALRAVRAGETATAEASFRETLELDPSRTDVRHAFVKFLQAAGRQRDADTETELLLTNAPDSAIALEIAGLRALAVERVDEAISHLERARELDPVAPWTLYGLGRAYLQRERYGEAAVALRTARMLSGSSFPDIDSLYEAAVRGTGSY